MRFFIKISYPLNSMVVYFSKESIGLQTNSSSRREDVYNYLNDFGSKEKEIENIEVKDNWIIIDGIKPVSKLPRIDDYATDNKGNKIKHILNYDNNLSFLDKYL